MSFETKSIKMLVMLPKKILCKKVFLILSYMPKSKSDNWVTPDKVFNKIEKYFCIPRSILFDPCPLDPKWNGLEIEWDDFNFVNPPYTSLTDFVSKSITQYKKHKTIVLLLPSKTDQLWFHELLSYNPQILWFLGRLKFVCARYSATQPHFLALLDGRPNH